MTIKPIEKNEENVDNSSSHRKSPVSQHDQRNATRTTNFIEENRHRRSVQKSSGSSKPQKHRYGSGSCSTSLPAASSLMDHIAEIDALNKNELATSQGTSNISQLIPSSPMSVLSTCPAVVNDMNAKISANLPTSSNHSNLVAADNIDAPQDDDSNMCSGYNSGDEHTGRKNDLTNEEWTERDRLFKKAMCEHGFLLEDIIEDGACLFRAISLQIYGDQDMHEVIRQQTMDYISQNREYFAQFVTEDILDYISRKRHNHVHGNHIEIQAISEIYNRPVELYSYETNPINIFNSTQEKNGLEPLRLSYQRGSHYNAIINPCKATVGVGLGLAGYRITEEAPNVKFMRDAVRMSEDLAIEQTMFEDKLKTTDWEATNEAIEEQIARESYIQWYRDNRSTQSRHPHSALIAPNLHYNIKSNSTVTSTAKESNCMVAASSHKSQQRASPNRCGASSDSNDLFTEQFDFSSNELSDEASSSKFHNYKIHSQRKRRSNRRPTTSTKMSNDRASNHHLEEPIALPSVAKKRKDAASTSNVAVQNDIQSSLEPSSDFYHSLLASSYSDTLNGVGEEHEEDIIQKALEISRMEYMKSIMQKAGSMSP